MWKKINGEMEVVVKYSLLRGIIISAIAAIVVPLMLYFILFCELEKDIVIVDSLKYIYDKGLAWDFTLMLIPIVFIMAGIIYSTKYVFLIDSKHRKK